jgi:hypothetical protein
MYTKHNMGESAGAKWVKEVTIAGEKVEISEAGAIKVNGKCIMPATLKFIVENSASFVGLYNGSDYQSVLQTKKSLARVKELERLEAKQKEIMAAIEFEKNQLK